MSLRESLRYNLSSESEAYGYTLSVWGSGAFLLQGFEMSAWSVFAFVLGGVIGFGLLALVAFRHLFSDVEVEEKNDFLIGSMVHILASAGTVMISYGMVSLGLDIPFNYLSFAVGFNTTFGYNVLLLIEDLLYKDLYSIEKSILNRL